MLHLRSKSFSKIVQNVQKACKESIFTWLNIIYLQCALIRNYPSTVYPSRPFILSFALGLSSSIKYPVDVNALLKNYLELGSSRVPSHINFQAALSQEAMRMRLFDACEGSLATRTGTQMPTSLSPDDGITVTPELGVSYYFDSTYT